ncbi:MAG: pyruvate dehydrogenase (acetyl-transferring), homodimeric type, partial [Actinomycetota bacterium]
MTIDVFEEQLPDRDPQETAEWLDGLRQLIADSPARARYLLHRLIREARSQGVGLAPLVSTNYINTIPPEQEPDFPGDEEMERRIRRIIRWNAVVMVSRANKHYEGIGGHISTYASAASLYEVGFNHFFRGKDSPGRGDQVYIQGHGAPGIYARAFLEGRVSEEQLDAFRREAFGGGLSSYPHPRLMPEFWEFPTVSMGLSPLNAIYQARFNKYLHNRGIKDTSGQRVWCFIGDGEMDEPESMAGLAIAAREELDNLIFVVNCNLQRLDGPVRGNGKIIQELESLFRGAGWHAIKVIWGREWDHLLANDVDGALVNVMNSTLDGEFQKYIVESGSYIREHFFGKDARAQELVAHLSDDEIWRLRRGGHDYRKLYAAYARAVEMKGAPTVILAKTVKGWGLESMAGRNVTHQQKKLTEEQLEKFRASLELPISDDDVHEGDAPYYHPGADSEEVRYLKERRKALGGFLPERRVTPVEIDLPKDDVYAEFAKGSGDQPVATTMAFVRLLRKLLRDKDIGKRVVPIIPDEARTFGMESLFPEFRIYAPHGQLYEPVDAKHLLAYKEAKDGQILEEGITEAGSMASFTAAGSSYATHGEPMLPFFSFYSMFGFQRIGDLAWAAGDSRSRGFLLGGTAGRTTLNGEGLQHEDGHSHLLSATIPNCVSYDPAFGYEVAVIVQDGLRRMLAEQEDVFYYLTLMNENYRHPAMAEGAQEGILRGLHEVRGADGAAIQLVGAGTILNEVLAAADLLRDDWGVEADVFSATSFTELRRDGIAADRHNRLHPAAKKAEVPWVAQQLDDRPTVAASDY